MTSKVWLIARHELATTVARPGWRIFAAAVPVIAVLALIGISIFQAVDSDNAPEAPGTTSVESEVSAGYVDESRGEDGQPLFTAFYTQGGVTFVPYADRESATADLLAERIALFYVFPADYLQTGRVVHIERDYSEFNRSESRGALRVFILSNLTSKVSDNLLARVVVPYQLVTQEIDESGVPIKEDDDESGVPIEEDDDDGDFFYLVMGMILVVAIFTSSGYLLQGLSEEKENRIMEVLLSSVRPEQLMFGKRLGLGAAGLLQMAVWTTTGVAAFFAFAAITNADLPQLWPSPATIGIGLVYFLLGFTFFGTLQAAVGAVTTSQKESNNIAGFFIVPAVSPVWFVGLLLTNSEGVPARFLSFFPFTAPISSLIRLSVGGMGTVDLIISVGLLSASVALVIWLTGRLFRAYLLMFGQRPRIGDIFRTLCGR